MNSRSERSITYLHRPHLLGREGEEHAVEYLQALGCEIVDRNWRGAFGEIDIIALDHKGELLFVEVKTRSSIRFGDPFEAITAEKYRRLYQLAREWSAEFRPYSRWRIDVILLLKHRHGFELAHHRGLIA